MATRRERPPMVEISNRSAARIAAWVVGLAVLGYLAFMVLLQVLSFMISTGGG